MEWISAKDRLPLLHRDTCGDGSKVLISEDVLVFCTDEYGEKREIVAFFERDDTGYHRLYTGWAEASEGTPINNVTHWMPLPEPPKD